MNIEAHVMQARERCNGTANSSFLCVGCASIAVQAALKEDRLKTIAMVRRYIGHRRDDPEPDVTLRYVIKEIEEGTYGENPEGVDRASDPQRPAGDAGSNGVQSHGVTE